MCRICGRMVKCIFDSMPSRTASRPTTQRIIQTVRQSTGVSNARNFSSASRRSLQYATLVTQSCTPIQLPFRSRLHTTSRQQADVQTSIPTAHPDELLAEPPMLQFTPQQNIVSATSITTDITAPSHQDASSSQKPLVLSKSLQSLLPALRAQQPHYITAHIHSFPYLLTEGDTLRLPFHMHGVAPGDVLRFNRATILGSRDYTLKAGYEDPQHSSPAHVRGEEYINKKRTGEPNYIDERLFECRLRVMGVDSGPMVIKEKKKRRNRRTRRVASKHKYTVLKVMQVRVKSTEELMSMDGQQVVLE